MGCPPHPSVSPPPAICRLRPKRQVRDWLGRIDALPLPSNPLDDILTTLAHKGIDAVELTGRSSDPCCIHNRPCRIHTLSTTPSVMPPSLPFPSPTLPRALPPRPRPRPPFRSPRVPPSPASPRGAARVARTHKAYDAALPTPPRDGGIKYALPSVAGLRWPSSGTQLVSGFSVARRASL